jgi:phosphatidylglycerophosphate synthase
VKGSAAITASEPPAVSFRGNVVLDARGPGSWERVGGIFLVARALFHLGKMGFRKTSLLYPPGRDPEMLVPWAKDLEVDNIEARPDFQWQQLGPALQGDRILFLDAAHLFDPRILYALAEMPGTALAFIQPSDRDAGIIRAGILTDEDVRLWAEEGGSALALNATPLFSGDIELFCPRTRGPRFPYFMEVGSPSEARFATRLLIRNQQKQVMDLPAQYLDPPLENALTYLLCNTPVTPNMVTFCCLAVAVMVGWLFWHGHFVAGALGTLLVEILDGVDGKLAWTKLRFSRLGAYEDIFDYLYENFWYVALGVGLTASVGGPLPAFLAALLVLADTSDNVFYSLAGKWYGKSIDLFTPFDGAFRRIAGRRNIYGIIFIFGFSLGHPLPTFAVAAVWGAVTAGLHGWRLIQYGNSGGKDLRQIQRTE